MKKQEDKSGKKMSEASRVWLAVVLLLSAFVLSLSSPFSFLTPPSSIWVTALLFTASVVSILAIVAICHIRWMFGPEGGRGSLTSAFFAILIVGIFLIPHFIMSVTGTGLFSNMSSEENQTATFWLSMPILAVLLSIGTMLLAFRMDESKGESEEATVTA